MKIIRAIPILVLLLTSMLCARAIAAADVEQLIKARQGFMALYAVNMELLADMVKGKARYNRKLAQDAADNLLALSRLHNSRLWPQGSGLDNSALRDLTRARPEIWKNRADVGALHADLVQSLEILVKNAGWSVDSLEESFADVAAACKACHEDYRAKPKR